MTILKISMFSRPTFITSNSYENYSFFFFFFLYIEFLAMCIRSSNNVSGHISKNNTDC